MRRRVAVVQDYVPNYRFEFFDRLVGRLAPEQIDVIVVAAHPPGANSRRGDSIESAGWLRQVDGPLELWPPGVGPAKTRGGPRIFCYGNDRHWRNCHGVIMGLRGADLDLHLELCRKQFSGRSVGVWGHIIQSVNPPNAIDLALERWQMRRSDHVFAYTHEGYESAVQCGLPPSKVTAVMNSTDVSVFSQSYARLSPTEVASFQRQHLLVPGKTFGYIGGLDSSKRIRFLSGALDLMWRTDPEVKVLVGGRGEDQELLSGAAERGQVVMLGYAGPAEKALIARASQALLNPGRIGLLAVEAMAVGIPILTTDWPYHAPEFNYLKAGRDVFISPDEISAFVNLIRKHVNHQLIVSSKVAAPFPRIEDMVENFASGVEAMLR